MTGFGSGCLFTLRSEVAFAGSLDLAGSCTMVSFVPTVPKASLPRETVGLDSGAECDGAGALCIDGEFAGDGELGVDV